MSVPQSSKLEGPTANRQISWSRTLRTFGTLLGFLLIVAFFSWQKPATFLTVNNWLNITQQVSILGVIAFTMTVVMVVGDFDLSVGTMASLSGIVIGTLFQSGQPIWVVVIAAMITGIIGGLLNGVLVSYIGISPFVATLGTMTIFGGVALVISGGSTIFGQVIPKEFSNFGNSGIFLTTVNERSVDLPFLTIFSLVVLVIIWIILEQTVFGRRLYAIGGNKEAAALGGVRVRLLRMMTFVISGLGAAVAGYARQQISLCESEQGDGLMLTAIAAVFLGMTMSEEGEPHVLGTLLGVFMIGVLANGLTQMQIDSYIQQILTGGIIILAVTLSSLTRRT